jgi:hypothetical protein
VSDWIAKFCSIGILQFWGNVMSESGFKLELIQTAVIRRGLVVNIVGLGVCVIGVLIGFSPLILAIVQTAPGHNPFSEGDMGSGGASLWLMIATLPIGAGVIFVGLLTLFVGLLITFLSEVPSADFPISRGMALARRSRLLNFLVVPVLMISEPIVVYVCGNMINFPGGGGPVFWSFIGAQALALAGAVVLAVFSKRMPVLVISILASLITAIVVVLRNMGIVHIWIF